MYYTDEMRRAFHAVRPKPNNLKMDVIDNDHFLTLRLDTKSFRSMTGEEKKRAVVYALMVKEALEQAGAVVMVVRDAEN